MVKLHLDTDLGGDIDDLAALAMLLKWPGAEITGITTVAEEGGRRAGYVRHALRLGGRGAGSGAGGGVRSRRVPTSRPASTAIGPSTTPRPNSGPGRSRLHLASLLRR